MLRVRVGVRVRVGLVGVTDLCEVLINNNHVR
jgi:hypothetical protein